MAPRIFDAHLHIIDAAFPLVPNQGFLPEPFTAADYQARIAGLGIAGGAVISGSFQAFDQTYLIHALARLGPSYVGVTQLPGTVTDDEIRALDAAGVRAVRFNLHRGGSTDLAALERLAHRVRDLVGWHCELYIDARQLGDIEAVVGRLPAVSIDHLGLHADGLPTLLRLVESGAKVKATGFGRVDLDPRSTIRRIMAIDPTSLVVGTDLPSTRARRAFTPDDFDLVAQTVEADRLEDVFWNNAAALYLSRPRLT